MTDQDGDALSVFHILPYRIVSNEYGDYPYERDHSEGELIATTLPALSEKLIALVRETTLSWATGYTSSYGDRYHDASVFARFNLEQQPRHYGLPESIARPPGNSYPYIALGKYRVEMRLEHGSAPDLNSGIDGFENVVPAMIAALEEAKTISADNEILRKAAAQAKSEAAKRAQLAALKKELGEE